VKKYLSRLALGLAAFATFAIAAPSSKAVSLADLLVPGATFVNGDKTFSDFTYSATGDMPSAAGVNVNAITDVAGNLGIQFQGGFHDDIGGDSSDALITFTVTVTAPGVEIHDANLVSNITVVGAGASGSLTETFLPEYNNLLLNTAVIHVDHTEFDPTTTVLHVQKDLLLDAGDSVDGLATVSFINQTFSQTAVPEPSTIAMAGIAGLSLLGLRLRRKSS
jgi:hypothetical protein